MNNTFICIIYSWIIFLVREFVEFAFRFDYYHLIPIDFEIHLHVPITTNFVAWIILILNYPFIFLLSVTFWNFLSIPKMTSSGREHRREGYHLSRLLPRIISKVNVIPLKDWMMIYICKKIFEIDLLTLEPKYTLFFVSVRFFNILIVLIYVSNIFKFSLFYPYAFFITLYNRLW